MYVHGNLIASCDQLTPIRVLTSIPCLELNIPTFHKRHTEHRRLFQWLPFVRKRNSGSEECESLNLHIANPDDTCPQRRGETERMEALPPVCDTSDEASSGIVLTVLNRMDQPGSARTEDEIQTISERTDSAEEMNCATRCSGKATVTIKLGSQPSSNKTVRARIPIDEIYDTTPMSIPNAIAVVDIDGRLERSDNDRPPPYFISPSSGSLSVQIQ